MKRLMPLFALSFVLASCESPIQTMQDMKDTTAKMAKTTSEMNDKMDQTNRNTSDLKDVSEHGFSEEKRSQKWTELFNSENIGDALTSAKVLMLSFEFQLKKLPKTEYGLELREHYIGDAIDEFFRKMKIRYKNNISSKLKKLDPQDLEGDKRKIERAWYALATTIHFKDIIQEKYIKEMGEKGVQIEEVSLYDLFKKALIKEANGQALTENESKIVVGVNKEIAIKLLQARLTFLTALGVDLSAQREGMSVKDSIAGLAFKITGGSIFGKKVGSLRPVPVLHKQNDATREQAITYFDAAIKTKRALEEMGVRPELEKGMKSIMENIDFTLEDDNTTDTYGGSANDLQQDLDRATKLKDELTRQNI